MIRNLIVLADGTELFSGTPGEAAIRSVTLTSQVNPDTELMPGGVCAVMLEASVFAPDGFSVTAGQEVTLFHVDEAGTRTQVGIFLAEQPVRESRHLYTLTAYDRVSCLDRDLSQWLFRLTDWPYTLQTFAGMVCDACGVTLQDTQLPNGAYLINAFSAEGITGRQLMAWVGQAAGRFCRATPEGVLELAWWQQTDICIGPSQTDTQHFYFCDGLTYADYQVKPVEKVQIRMSDEDVGAIWPDEETAENILTITGNYLLTTAQADALEPVAENLYEIFKDITYTPGQVRVSAGVPVRAGDIITVTDGAGKTMCMYVMTRVVTGQSQTLTCTGSPSRDSSQAVNNASYKALTGKVLNLRMDVEGLKVENKDAAGNLAAIQLDVEGISTEVVRQQSQVEGLHQQVTRLEQDAQGLTIQVQSILDNGTDRIQTGMGYTFDDTGLHIQKEGDAISTCIDQAGMQVSRSGENVLQATAEGVKAIDITVKNYLVVGSHARFEDYTDGADSDRTACFYI